jgi:hypothetical protein
MILALFAASWSANALACDVTTPTNVTVGTSFSPSAIKAGMVPYTKTLGGFSCSSVNILTLLSGNFLKATVASGATLQLTATGTSDVVTYKLYADSTGTNELKPGVEAFYINGTVLNLLNLAGNGAIDVPVHFKLASSGFVTPGTYSGSFSIKWDWLFCSGIGVLGACIGTPDQGSKSATVNVTLVVQPKPPTVTVDVGTATWNIVEGSSNPKAIPLSKRRLRLTVTNPDIVPVEANTLKVVLPTPSTMTVALDGDGTGGAVVQTSEGSPASTLTLSYVSPTDTGDNVDFSSDGGTTWTYYPTLATPATWAAVNRIRFRPQGAMAALSSYTISIPYSVK